MDSKQMKEHKNRKAQILNFARELEKDANLKLTPAQRKKLHLTLRDTAMCAAFEERHRTMTILRDSNAPGRIELYDKISKLAVLAVLGYE